MENANIEKYIIDIRREIHRNPEISCKEFRTKELIIRELTRMGIPHVTFEDSTAVLGIMQCAGEGRRIGILADFDALPLQEESGVEFSSAVDGVMHACGHDAHTAMLLGATEMLRSQKDELDGTIFFLFQPAEEYGLGTKEFEDYFHENGGLDRMLGMHVAPFIPTGEMGLLKGTVFGGAQDIIFDIYGKGGHGAMPEQCDDPIKAACDLVTQISSIPANYFSAVDRCVVSICLLQAGTKGNIMPDSAHLHGAVRYFVPDSLEKINAIIERMSQGIALTHNVRIDFKPESPDTAMPPVVNDAESVELAKKIVNSAAGLKVSEALTEPKPLSDNISKLMNEYPGVFALLGTYNEQKGCIWPLHSPKFRLDEDILLKGAEFFAKYAAEYLKTSES